MGCVSSRRAFAAPLVDDKSERLEWVPAVEAQGNVGHYYVRDPRKAVWLKLTQTT